MYLQGLTANTDTDYSLRKATKGHKRPIIKIYPIRKNSKDWTRSDKREEGIFAQHLEQTFKPFPRMKHFH